MLVVFVTDSLRAGKGFSAKFTAIIPGLLDSFIKE